MKIKSFLAIAMAAMTLVACKNDGTDGIDTSKDGEALSGEQTYAVIDLKVSTGGTKAVTPPAGDETALDDEVKIGNAGIYIFKYVSEGAGEAEVMKDGITPVANTGNVAEIPAQAVMLSSGHKHLVVVTNMTEAAKTALAAAFNDVNKGVAYAKFYQVLQSLGTSEATYDIANLVTAGGITMSGEADPTLLAGITAAQAQTETNTNHVTVQVDRLPAKIDVALDGYAANMTVETDAAVTLATVSELNYDARNMNYKEYIMKRFQGVFVTTPECEDFVAGITPPQENNNPFNTAYTSRYRLGLTAVGTDGTFPSKLLGADADRKGAAYKDYVTYMPENTNKVARKGNTSYVAMKASYTPAADYYVNGVTAGHMAGTTLVPPVWVKSTAAFVANQFSLFNYDWNVAFEPVATVGDAKINDYYKALAVMQLSAVEPALQDLTVAQVKFADAVTGFDPDQDIDAPTNDATLAAVTTENTLYIKVTKTANAANTLEQTIITASYYWDPELDGTYIINDGVGVVFGKLTCGMYTTNTTGLVCYYRVNIFDEAEGITSLMKYAVVRNYSYHMTISKINQIGYPTQIDLIVNPEEPINNNTFVQAHVIMNKWTGKNMGDVELGM